MKVKQEEGNKERPRDGYPWDEGEIQGRSIDLGGSVFRSVGREYGKGNKEGGCWRREQGTRIRARGGLGGGGGGGETRTIECGGVLGSLVGSNEGD